MLFSGVRKYKFVVLGLKHQNNESKPSARFMLYPMLKKHQFTLSETSVIT